MTTLVSGANPAPAAAAPNPSNNPGSSGVQVNASPVNPSDAGVDVKWKESLAEDLRSDPNLQSIKDLNGLAKSFIHAQKMIGADKIALPGKNATPEDWKQAVYSKLGLPESIDKYEVKPAENAKLDEAFLSKFKEKAYGLNVLPNQAQELLNWYTSELEVNSTEFQKGYDASVQKDIEGLKTEWGNAFDSNVQKANLAAKHFGGIEFAKYLGESGLGNDVNVVKFLAKIGNSLKEDTFKGEAIGNLGKSPDQASKEIERIMGDLKGPYYDKMHPAHDRTVAEVQDLYKIKLGIS